jgi:protease IV
MRRASIKSIVCAAGVLVGVGASANSAFAQAVAESSVSQRARIAKVELKGALAERQSELSWLFGSGGKSTLRDLVEAIRDAAKDDGVQGMVIRLKDSTMGVTQLEEIGAALKEFRATGKKVHLFSDYYTTPEFLLGSYVDEVIAQSGGPAMMPGMHMEEMFLADTLAWAGLKADMVQVGAYKGASEQMGRSGPSPEWDQNINQLLDSMYTNMRAPILAGRKLNDAQLDGAMEKLWLADAGDAKDAGLVDKVIDLPELTDTLRGSYDKPVAWTRDLLKREGGGAMDMSNPFAMLAKLGQKPDYSPSGPTIAVVHIDGPIVDGDSKISAFSGSGNVGSRTIRSALEEIRGQSDIKGVVLRINSPGGSATASEMIWQGVQRLAEKKPVWVSVGSMAASGGYYIAVGGQKIYVNPSSIVGSIGVVGGKISMEELYKKLKVNVVSRSRGPHADMFASNRVWNEQDLALVRAKMTDTYNQFTSRVTAGRPGIDLNTTAAGRLFTGNKAIGMKMADKLGGLATAIDDMGKELSLSDFDVMEYPAPRSFEDVMKDSLGGMVQAPGVASPFAARGQFFAAVREVVGERVFEQLQPQLEGFLQLRDQHVLLMSPKALIFK